MSFANFLEESTGDVVKDTMKVLKAEFDESAHQVKWLAYIPSF